MSITIGSNISSLMAQRGLNDATKSIATGYERLSSGLRINHASDDTAGLAVSESLKVSAKLANQAGRNVTDALSALVIAEQGLRAQQQVLQRAHELAEQGANGTYSYTQRKNLQKEYKSLLDEYLRIGSVTEFNGQKLLNGSTQTLSIQSGTKGGADATLQVAMPARATLAGEEWVKVDYNNSGTITALDSGLLNTIMLGLTSEPTTIDNLADCTKGGIVSFELVDSSGRQRDVYGALVPMQRWTLGFPAQTSVWFLVADSSGKYALQNIVTANIGQQNQLTVTFSDNGAQASVNVDLTDITLRTWDTVTSHPAAAIKGNRRTALYCTGVEGTSRAKLAIETLNNRLEDLSVTIGNIGANQARLTEALAQNSHSSLEYTAAASRITDADFAQESAALLSKQITQQAASAVLAQANQQPRVALQLLG